MTNYIPTDWKDEIVDGAGNVVQKGTPLSAANLKKLEAGVEGAVAAVVDKVDGVVFDEFKTATTTALAETANLQQGKNLNTECYISFMDDDFTNDVIMDWMIDLFKTENIPLNVAVIGFFYDEAGKVARMKRVKETGGNVCSHTQNHVNLSEITDENTLRMEIVETANWLSTNGFDNVMVYPYGTYNALSNKITREVYDFAIGVGEGINDKYTSFSNFNLKRISGIGESNSTLEYCKEKVLEAKANGGWLIFKQHAKNDWTSATKQQLIDLIAFIKSEGIEVVSVRDGFEKKKNPIDVSGEKGDYFRTSQYGIVDWSETYWRKVLNTNKLDVKGQSLDIDSPITSYEHGETNMYFRNVDLGLGKGEPATAGGMLITNRPLPIVGGGDYGAFQLYYQYNNNDVFKRRWNLNDNIWSAWELISSGRRVIIGANILPTSTTLLSDFPLNSVSVHAYTSAQAAINGFASSLTLITSRVGSNGEQTYINSGGTQRYRVWNATNSTWGEWHELAKIKKYSHAVDFGTIPARSVVQKSVASTGHNRKNVFSINPDNSMSSSLFLDITTTSSDLRIKIFNASDVDVALGLKTFYITELVTGF